MALVLFCMQREEILVTGTHLTIFCPLIALELQTDSMESNLSLHLHLLFGNPISNFGSRMSFSIPNLGWEVIIVHPKFAPSYHSSI